MLIFFALLAIMGSSNNNKIISPIPSTTSTPSATLVPTEAIGFDTFKDNYMEGCLGEDNTQFSYCNCTYEKLLSKLGKAGFMKMAIKYAEDKEFSDVMVEVYSDCSRLYK